MDCVFRPIYEPLPDLPSPRFGVGGYINNATQRGKLWVNSEFDLLSRGLEFVEDSDFWEALGKFFTNTDEKVDKGRRLSPFRAASPDIGDAVDIDGDGISDGSIDSAIDFSKYAEKMQALFGDFGISYEDISSFYNSKVKNANFNNTYAEIIENEEYKHYSVERGFKLVVAILEDMRRIAMGYQAYGDIENNPWWLNEAGGHNLAGLSLYADVLNALPAQQGIFDGSNNNEFYKWVFGDGENPGIIDEYYDHKGYDSDNPPPFDFGNFKAEWQNFSNVIEVLGNITDEQKGALDNPMFKGFSMHWLIQDLTKIRNKRKKEKYVVEKQKMKTKKFEKKRLEAKQMAEAQAKARARRQKALMKSNKKGVK